MESGPGNPRDDIWRPPLPEGLRLRLWREINKLARRERKPYSVARPEAKNKLLKEGVTRGNSTGKFIIRSSLRDSTAGDQLPPDANPR